MLQSNDGWSVFGGYKAGTSEFLFDAGPGNLVFNTTGIFGGVSKAISLSGGNSIALSAALASMSANIYDTPATIDEKGTSIGLSFAGVYNIPLSDTSGVNVRGTFQNYQYRNFDSLVDISESIFGVEAGYYINF